MSGATELARVAAAIAARYGLPPAELSFRMAGGRFRVKSGIDRETAERLLADLEAMGARCTIEDASGQPVSRNQPEKAGSPGGQASQTAATGYQSGLAAAMHASSTPQDLGVLDKNSSGFSLTTLDGEDEDEGPPPGQEAVPTYDASAFAPPESQTKEDHLQLAIDPKRSRRPASAPVTMAAENLAPVVDLASSPASTVPGTGAGPVAVLPPVDPQRSITTSTRRAVVPQRAGKSGQILGQLRELLGPRPRIRFATGVLLALLVGFLGAHIFASIREGSVYDRIDHEVTAEQDSVTTIEEWNQLDSSRQIHLGKKQSARRNIALGGIFVWILVGAGTSYLWFRRIDWDA